MDPRGTAGSSESSRNETPRSQANVVPIARLRSWAKVAARQETGVRHVPAQREYAGAA